MSHARSVNDFDTPEGLRSALKNSNNLSSFDDAGRDFPRALIGSKLGVPRDDDSQSECSTIFEPETDLDWLLSNHDENNSYAQTLDSELNRLQVLKSYMILDSAREAKFERLTGLAARMFHVPIALVSLVDLGRQWFMSNRGLGDCKETPRQIAFCAHAIISKDDLLIVPDATKDPRFMNSPLVLGPPFIRFYAGAPLICPEGFKLGTLCVIDSVIRPHGLNLEERQNLSELAALVIDVMVERRREKLSILQDKSQIIATTAHDLLTPLSGVQMSLSLLMDDEKFMQNLTDNNQDLIGMASACASVMNRVCNDAIQTFRNDSLQQKQHLYDDDPEGLKKIVLVEFVKGLNMMLELFPKSVPFYISIDSLVPAEICVIDDLKIFRSAMNYLTNALKKTEKGSVHLKIYLGGKKKKPTVIFECEDTGPGIPPENYEFLFRPFRESQVVECIRVDESGKVDANACLPKMSNSGLGLYSVANQITSIGGEYGFRPREGINDLSGETGAVFWFSFPLIVPSKSKDKSKESESHAPCDGTKAQCGNGSANSQQTPYAERNNISEQKVVRILSSKKMEAKESALLVNIVKNAIADDLESNECRRPRRTLVIDDSIVIRKSVGRALSRLGYEVDQATNGLEGLQKLQQNVYDVVLCDFLMPVMDGLDCVQQYRDWESTHRPWISQYIVGISAHASPSDIDKGKQAGMNDFKPKPVTLKQLKELENSVTWVEVTKKLDEIDNLEPSVNHIVSVQESKEVSSCSAEELPYDSKSTDDTRPICLIGEPENENFMKDCVTQYGWRAVHVHDGEDALRLLKMRNWDAVFIANDISRLNGIGCVARFRDWESENRVTRQNNVILLSSDFVPPPDQTIVATYPLGFDGALGRPVLLKSVEFFLNLAQTSKSDTASSKSIVAR